MLCAVHTSRCLACVPANADPQVWQAHAGPPAAPAPPQRPTNCVRLPRAWPPPPQAFLTKLLTIDLPALMVLPQRLEINIPPAVTAGAPPSLVPPPPAPACPAASSFNLPASCLLMPAPLPFPATATWSA